MHMFWPCPIVDVFWSYVQNTLSNILGKSVHKDPWTVLLLVDSAELFSAHEKRTFLAGLTAGKKTIMKIWFEPSVPAHLLWPSYFRDITLLECTAARITKAKIRTVVSWSNTEKELLKAMRA